MQPHHSKLQMPFSHISGRSVQVGGGSCWQSSANGFQNQFIDSQSSWLAGGVGVGDAVGVGVGSPQGYCWFTLKKSHSKGPRLLKAAEVLECPPIIELPHELGCDKLKVWPVSWLPK